MPPVYAAAMAADALAALATGWLYDKADARTLIALPLLSAAVPLLAFTNTLGLTILGALLGGCAVGVQESTLRAVVADLVPSTRRATAYGIFAGALGGATLIGGEVTGALYDYAIPALIITVAVIQVGAIALLVAANRSADS
ncbi:MFS transporter [Amycolatopsis sp.]|uniref:MFS transporter n=1 Tax=Amycolatopsis sp. TaxID=37632 RepID=UPI002BF26053|nr:MFS transporter [Amycolatopsis sp.]HVV12048.1 MFS transporter [Amycolatopsis sp.]